MILPSLHFISFVGVHITLNMAISHIIATGISYVKDLSRSTNCVQLYT
jgi:hypothetical protein